jgi:hypothetical protein
MTPYSSSATEFHRCGRFADFGVRPGRWAAAIQEAVAWRGISAMDDGFLFAIARIENQSYFPDI